MSNDYLCKKCKLRQDYYNNDYDIEYNNDSILVYEDVVGPYEKLIPDSSVAFFSFVCLGIMLLVKI